MFLLQKSSLKTQRFGRLEEDDGNARKKDSCTMSRMPRQTTRWQAGLDSHTGEPDAVKVACPVRGGAVGKVSAMITRWPPTLHLYGFPATWVDYDSKERQFTAQAQAKLKETVAQHYQRALARESEADESAAAVGGQEANDQLVKLWQQFNEMGSDLYGNRWTEVSRHNVERVTDGATDNPEELTVTQLETLISGMEQIKRKRKSGRPTKQSAKAAA